MDLIKIAKELVIETEEQATEASEMVKKLKELENEIRASFDPVIDKAYKAHKEAIAQRDEHLKPVLEAQRKLKSVLCDWHTKQEQIKLEEARREAERLRKLEEEKILAQASQLEMQGETKLAEEILNTPVTVSPKYEKPKIQGISFAEIWDFEILDEKLIPREYLIPDEQKIRQIVKATKGELNIPGIKIFKRKVAR